MESTDQIAGNRNYVIIDCDCGTDDAWALLMMIKAEEVYKAYEILGITCVFGNTEVTHVCRNTLRLLESIERTDILVYKGCSEAIVPRTEERTQFFHGKDGFGDVYSNIIVNEEIVKDTHAVNAMYDFVCKYPNKVSFILLGPLTNFAVAAKTYSDFLDKVKDVYIMGGNIEGNDKSSTCAEFNFSLDPEAAHFVLENTKVPTTILPWEPCLDVDYGLNWRLDILGTCSGKAMELLNGAEKAILVPKCSNHWIVADAILTAIFIFPSYIIQTEVTCGASVELHNNDTKAHMILDKGRSVASGNQKRIVTEIHKENFKRLISWVANFPGVDIEWEPFN